MLIMSKYFCPLSKNNYPKDREIHGHNLHAASLPFLHFIPHLPPTTPLSKQSKNNNQFPSMSFTLTLPTLQIAITSEMKADRVRCTKMSSLCYHLFKCDLFCHHIHKLLIILSFT